MCVVTEHDLSVIHSYLTAINDLLVEKFIFHIKLGSLALIVQQLTGALIKLIEHFSDD